MINKQQTPMIFDFQMKNILNILVNAMYKQAWISQNKYQELRELLQTDLKRAIEDLVNLLTELKTDIRKLKKGANHGV